MRYRPHSLVGKPEDGQTHTVEIVIFVLIAVVLGLFVYTVGVPAIEGFWTDVISRIGTIR